MKKNAGASTVEFILVLPWLIFIFLAFLFLIATILIANRLHYQAYSAARKTGLYELSPVPKLLHLPIHFTLGNESADLSRQPERDRWGYPLMDNWIPYCGKEGKYFLCRD